MVRRRRNINLLSAAIAAGKDVSATKPKPAKKPVTKAIEQIVEQDAKILPPESRSETISEPTRPEAKVKNQTPPAASVDAVDDMRINGYPLTDEQKVAVRLALKNESLKIEAFAGAGKTSTLKAIAEAKAGQKGIYLAFNKSIATEADKEFPDNVECKTAHSLAFRSVGSKYQKSGRLRGSINGSFIAKEFDITHYFYDTSPAALGNIAMATVTKFCQGGDYEINSNCSPWSELMKIADKDVRKEVAKETLRIAREIWARMMKRGSNFPITHDVYLKEWALKEPVIKKDFILFDEAQDANGVMLSIVLKQKAQKIFVGDRYQQIYAWRGAENAMSTIDTKHSCQITQSFRFGAAIADTANYVLSNHLGCKTKVVGFDKVESSCYGLSAAEADVMIFRTNGKLIGALSGLLRKGVTVYVEGGVGSYISLLKGIEELRKKDKSSHPELLLFGSYAEFIEFVESDAGGELKTVWNLLENYSTDELIKMLKKCDGVRESQADITLTTAHKSKGREWSMVKLASDFRLPDDKNYNSEESNLLYVALTRAKNVLDFTDIDLYGANWDEDED